MRGVVPVVGLRPLLATPGGFDADGFPQHGVVAVADAVLLDIDGRQHRAGRVRRGAHFRQTFAVSGKVVVDRKTGRHAGDVVEASPVAGGIGEGLVGHHVVQAADLAESDLRRAAVFVHDLPCVLECVRGGVVDGDPHAVRDVLDAQVAAPPVGAYDAPDAGRGGVRNRGVGMGEELEGAFRD